MNGSFARVLLLTVILVPSAQAYDFTLSMVEWKTWPEYCRAKYVGTDPGKRSQFRSLVPRETVERWQGALGEEAFYSIHHGCAGLIWIQRAERLRGKDQRQYDFAVGKAMSESLFTLERLPPEHPLNVKMRLTVARAEYHRGHAAKCFQMLDQIAAEAPDFAEVYAVHATYLYRQNDYNGARAVLERGMQAVPQPTAEMHYFLGLVMLRQQAYEEARVQAEEAYKLGYPLPGLRKRLQSLGYWGT